MAFPPFLACNYRVWRRKIVVPACVSSTTRLDPAAVRMNKFAGFVIALLAVVVGLCALYPGGYAPMPTQDRGRFNFNY
jgi:hypothetical protein